MESVSKMIKLFKQDPITTFCGMVFALSYYIVNNQDSVFFLSPQISNIIIKTCDFLVGASISVGLFFATQAKSKHEEIKINDYIQQIPEDVEKNIAKKSIKKSKQKDASENYEL